MSVYDYLLSKGIYGDRLVYIGFGEKVPIADNSTEAGRALNRRVEFEIVK
jgi:OOP family OmpA-OmpF porin